MKAMAGALLERGHRAVSLWWSTGTRSPANSTKAWAAGPIAEKRASHVEVAYGWTDLRRLIASPL
jgi:hypothetical protein